MIAVPIILGLIVIIGLWLVLSRNSFVSIKNHRTQGDGSMETSGIQIYAYCLMSNHVHLLMKEGNEDLGTVFKRIGSSYVYWHNWKYNRRGHLFQDRYRSEAVEDDGYFLTVIRYIHNNPIKAGITKELSEYRWCSYNEYTNRKNICNVESGLGILSNDTQKAIGLL